MVPQYNHRWFFVTQSWKCGPHRTVILAGWCPRSQCNRDHIGLLHEMFPNCLVARRGYVNWPVSKVMWSHFLWFFFLWEFVKSQVYATKPKTVSDLKDKIRRVIADPTKDFSTVFAACQQVKGEHLNNIIFHT